jgi:pentatricopeptide repeat protein
LTRQQVGRTNVRLLNWRTRSFFELMDYQSLEGVLEEFAQEGLKANRRTYYLLISGFLRNRDLKRAQEVLKQMEAAGFPIDASTHGLVVSAYRSFGPDHQVQARALESLEGVGGGAATMILNSLIQLRLDAHDLSGALQILSLFDQRKINPVTNRVSGKGTTTPGEGASLHRTESDASTPNLPIIPDSRTFSIIIRCISNNLPLTLRVLHQMQMCGIQPDSGVVVALLSAYFQAGDESAAIRFVVEMCARSQVACEPLLILVSSTEQKLDVPHALLDVQPTVDVFNTLLKGLLTTRGLKGAKCVFRTMNKAGISPDAKTVDHFISHLDRVERARPRTLLRVLRSFLSITLQPTLRHLHIVLNSVLREEKFAFYGSGWNANSIKSFSRSKELHPSLKRIRTSPPFDPTAGIKLNRSSHSALLRPIIQSMVSRNTRSDRATLAMRIRFEAITKDQGDAKDVFQTLLARGMHPNEYHFAAIMEGYALSGDLKAAEGVLGSVAQARLKPNIVMFTILIVAHARQGHPDQAMRIFQKMVAAGIKPDVPSIDAVASAYFLVGAFAMSRRVLINLWPHIRPFPRELRTAPLKTLAREFRALHGNENQGTLSKHKRLMLHWKVNELLEIWNGRRRRPFRRERSGLGVQHTPRSIPLRTRL